MKYRHIMEEIEKSIEDKAERSRVMDGLLGYILNTTQVLNLSPKLLSLSLYTRLLTSLFPSFLFGFLQEDAVVPPYVAFAVRPSPGLWEFVKVSADDLGVDGITSAEYLKFKETIFDENWYAWSY